MAQSDNFAMFMGNVMHNPGAEGVKGWCFVFFALPVFVLCGLYGVSFFPAGRYPTILLLVPGFGFVVYKVRGGVVVLAGPPWQGECDLLYAGRLDGRLAIVG